MALLALIIGAAAIGVVWAIVRIRRSRLARLPKPPLEPLSAHLHRLGGAIEAFTSSGSHPRELTDRPDFKEAVDLLAQADIPLETVRQYALGANSALSCVALASLALRADRYQLLGPVLSEFHSLLPWPIYFGLEYLLSLDNRPAVGAPVLSVREWWSYDPAIPALFRDYFARREQLGDRANFGTALAAGLATEPKQIEQFLRTIDHPFAASLRAELGSWKASTVDRSFLRSMGRIWSTDEPANCWSNRRRGASSCGRPRAQFFRSRRDRCWSAVSRNSARLRCCACSATSFRRKAG